MYDTTSSLSRNHSNGEAFAGSFEYPFHLAFPSGTLPFEFTRTNRYWRNGISTFVVRGYSFCSCSLGRNYTFCLCNREGQSLEGWEVCKMTYVGPVQCHSTLQALIVYDARSHCMADHLHDSTPHPGFSLQASHLTRRLAPPDNEWGLKIMRDDGDVADGKYLSLLIKKRTRTQAMLVAVDAY
jgi:hypothetical protein